jgi:hypothetical protein
MTPQSEFKQESVCSVITIFLITICDVLNAQGVEVVIHLIHRDKNLLQ